jgi:hypothetical protein
MFLIVDRLWRLFDIVNQIKPAAEAGRADERAGGEDFFRKLPAPPRPPKGASFVGKRFL